MKENIITFPKHSQNILSHPREKVYLLHIYAEKLISESADKRGMQMIRDTEKKKDPGCSFEQC